MVAPLPSDHMRMPHACIGLHLEKLVAMGDGYRGPRDLIANVEIEPLRAVRHSICPDVMERIGIHQRFISRVNKRALDRAA
ncbi:hypothetical protein [Paraburkholderia dipogonis]|uniref:hypothetical protein n=1 Tax=Paraburkholderia dipogonis TaxID=1211383 RepID=UPI0038B9B7D2